MKKVQLYSQTPDQKTVLKIEGRSQKCGACHVAEQGTRDEHHLSAAEDRWNCERKSETHEFTALESKLDWYNIVEELWKKTACIQNEKEKKLKVEKEKVRF